MRRIVIFSFLSFFLYSAVWGAEAPRLEGYDNTQPIEVSSNSLEADSRIGQVRFLGDVVARQGDMVIYAQELRMIYGPESQEVDRIEVTGDVRIHQGKRVATGQKGVFFNRESKVVLSGSPRVHQGEDFIEGDEITVFLKEDRSVVSSQGRTRVNAIFHPKGDQ